MAVHYSAIAEADGDEEITVAGTAQTLTAPAEFTRNGSFGGKAEIQCRTAALIFTLTGTGPTDQDATTGMTLDAGDILVLYTKTEIANLKMIRATGTSALVHVQYSKRIN